MSKKTLKLTLAGALVTCGLGGFGLGLAWATPPQGFTATNLVGPVLMDQVNTNIEGEDWGAKLKTKGFSDVYVTHLKIVPGGHGGWHSHPGPSLITVKSGTATFLDECDFFIPHTYTAGNGFEEDANCVHILANQGDVDLEVIVVQIVPQGAPRRIDEPSPF